MQRNGAEGKDVQEMCGKIKSVYIQGFQEKACKYKALGEKNVEVKRRATKGVKEKAFNLKQKILHIVLMAPVLKIKIT